MTDILRSLVQIRLEGVAFGPNVTLIIEESLLLCNYTVIDVQNKKNHQCSSICLYKDKPDCGNNFPCPWQMLDFVLYNVCTVLYSILGHLLPSIAQLVERRTLVVNG